MAAVALEAFRAGATQHPLSGLQEQVLPEALGRLRAQAAALRESLRRLAAEEDAIRLLVADAADPEERMAAFREERLQKEDTEVSTFFSGAWTMLCTGQRPRRGAIGLRRTAMGFGGLLARVPESDTRLRFERLLEERAGRHEEPSA